MGYTPRSQSGLNGAFSAYGLISSFRIASLDCSPSAVSGYFTGILGDHLVQSLSGSDARVNWEPFGAAGASAPMSGVAKATPPVTSYSSDVSLSWAPPKRLTLNEKPPVFQNFVLVRTRSP